MSPHGQAGSQQGASTPGRSGASDGPTTVRLDVWLWAARFFKTRALAKDAVGLGKVEIGGQRAKPSRTVRVSGPRWERAKPLESGWATVPKVGLIPNTPLSAAGMRIDPAPSEP